MRKGRKRSRGAKASTVTTVDVHVATKGLGRVELAATEAASIGARGPRACNCKIGLVITRGKDEGRLAGSQRIRFAAPDVHIHMISSMEEMMWSGGDAAAADLRSSC